MYLSYEKIGLFYKELIKQFTKGKKKISEQTASSILTHKEITKKLNKIEQSKEKLIQWISDCEL